MQQDAGLSDRKHTLSRADHRSGGNGRHDGVVCGRALSTSGCHVKQGLWCLRFTTRGDGSGNDSLTDFSVDTLGGRVRQFCCVSMKYVQCRYRDLLDRGHNAFTFGIKVLGLHILCDLLSCALLLGSVRKNSTAVLRPDVRPLPVQLRGVVRTVKEFDELSVRDLVLCEGNHVRDQTRIEPPPHSQCAWSRLARMSGWGTFPRCHPHNRLRT